MMKWLLGERGNEACIPCLHPASHACTQPGIKGRKFGPISHGNQCNAIHRGVEGHTSTGNFLIKLNLKGKVK